MECLKIVNIKFICCILSINSKLNLESETNDEPEEEDENPFIDSEQ